MDECCPKFNPKPWDGKVFKWKNKRFVKARVFTLFYMPINFGSVISKAFKRLDEAGAKSHEWMGLSDHTSPWNMDLYLAVNKKIPGMENAVMNGTYYSKVYEGDFKDTGKWCGDYAELAKAKGFTTGRLFMWYTTCPKCAKKYGRNYVVILSEVKKPESSTRPRASPPRRRRRG